MTTIDPVIGQIVSAHIGATHATMNQINDLGWAAAQEWAERFAKLYDLVERDNDSVRVDRHLAGFDYHRGSVEGQVEHYERMKMSSVQERLDSGR